MISKEVIEMGEKKQVRLTMDFPFYTQQMTQENWQEEQFLSLEEAEHWTFRSCGIASLRMVLDGFGRNAERHWPMIEKGVAAGAYKPGVGWIHWGLAKMALEYGVYGEALRGKTAEELKQELDHGYNYGKGGHLVPCFGYETVDGELTVFLVHHPSAFAEKNKPEWWVPMEDFLASFGGNFIRFSAEPFSAEE